MLNEVVLQGRLTRDPELRYTQSQTPVCSFSIACERDRKDGNGEKQADFIDAVAWKQQGEFVSKNFSKGSMIIVRGRLEVRQWTDRDNVKRLSPEINVERVWFGESKRKSDPDERPPMPGDEDAPPEVDQEGLAALAAAYPNNVEYADPNEKLPWE